MHRTVPVRTRKILKISNPGNNHLPCFLLKMTEKDDFSVFYPLKDMNDNMKNINPTSSPILLKQYFYSFGR